MTYVDELLRHRDRNMMWHGVRMLQDYWCTYDMQLGYEDYSVKTLIEDALYGLGLAIDKEQFNGPEGYKRFRAVLLSHLGSTQQTPLTKE